MSFENLKYFQVEIGTFDNVALHFTGYGDLRWQRLISWFCETKQTSPESCQSH